MVNRVLRSKELVQIKMENDADASNTSMNETFTSDAFWNMLQSEKGVEIPVYIKNILALNNLDNPISFQCINDDAIVELEEFTRESLKDFLKKGDSLENYYGRYHKMPQKFRFLIGDRFLIKKLVSYVSSKPDEYWKSTHTSEPATPIAHTSLTSHTPRSPRTPHTPHILPFNQVYIKGDILSGSEDEEENKEKKLENIQLREPPNRALEKEDLLRQVKNSMRRDLKNFPNLLAQVDQASVKVQVRKVFDKQRNEEHFLSTGNIRCCLCPVTITIRKHYIEGKRKPRWIISNFRRHVKSHTRPKGGPVDSPTEEDAEYCDMEVYKEEDDTFNSSEQVDLQEDEGDEVSYRVTW